MKKVLYVFDDMNYASGARKVTLFQMKQLARDYEISAFSLTKPDSEEVSGIPMVCPEVWAKTTLLSQSLKTVLASGEISVSRKLYRICYSLLTRMRRDNSCIASSLTRGLREQFEQFDCVIVVSEASKLRKFVSTLQHPKKIQWIHTDYAGWSNFSGWTRMVTEQDGRIYQNFDAIVTLSEYSRNSFLQKLPSLEKKTVAIPNLIDGDTILARSELPLDPDISFDKTKLNLITIGRLDKEKAYDRILDICKDMIRQQLDFRWYLMGDGPERQHLQKRITQEGLSDHAILLGNRANPYSLLKRCDCFLLLSEYEGTPVTIDEAKVLGIPVIARDVGGIKEQLEGYEGGRMITREDTNDTTIHAIEAIAAEHTTHRQHSYIHANQKILQHLKVLLDKE